jgi:hypothetical protein
VGSPYLFPFGRSVVRFDSICALRKGVRIFLTKIDKLACQAK